MNFFATDFEGKAIEIRPRKYHSSYENHNKKEAFIKEPNIDYRKSTQQGNIMKIQKNSLDERKRRLRKLLENENNVLLNNLKEIKSKCSLNPVRNNTFFEFVDEESQESNDKSLLEKKLQYDLAQHKEIKEIIHKRRQKETQQMQLMQILHKKNLKSKNYQEDIKWKGIAFDSDKSQISKDVANKQLLNETKSNIKQFLEKQMEEKKYRKFKELQMNIKEEETIIQNDNYRFEEHIEKEKTIKKNTQSNIKNQLLKQIISNQEQKQKQRNDNRIAELKAEDELKRKQKDEMNRIEKEQIALKENVFQFIEESKKIRCKQYEELKVNDQLTFHILDEKLSKIENDRLALCKNRKSLLQKIIHERDDQMREKQILEQKENERKLIENAVIKEAEEKIKKEEEEKKKQKQINKINYRKKLDEQILLLKSKQQEEEMKKIEEESKLRQKEMETQKLCNDFIIRNFETEEYHPFFKSSSYRKTPSLPETVYSKY